MKPLTIGQVVRVFAISELEYTYSEHQPARRVVATHFVEPFLAVITGQVRKLTGQYRPASQPTWAGGDYDPASLAVDKVVTLWEVRAGMLSKARLVRDEDLEPAADEFKLPTTAPRPKRLEWLPMNEAPRTGETILALFEGEEVKVRWAENRSDPALNFYGEGWEDDYNHYAMPDDGFDGWKYLES